MKADVQEANLCCRILLSEQSLLYQALLFSLVFRATTQVAYNENRGLAKASCRSAVCPDFFEMSTRLKIWIKKGIAVLR